MLSASPQIHTPADEPVDQSVLDREAQSVGHMFRRPHRRQPRPAGLPARRGLGGRRRVGHGDLGRARRRGPRDRGRADRPGHRARAAGRHRLEHPLRVDPGRPRDHVRRRRDHDGLPVDDRRGRRRTSSADSECRVVFAEDDEQIAKLREHTRRAARTCAKVVIFDGAVRRRLGDRPRRPRASSATSYLAEHPGAIDDRIDGDPARPAGHADLHLRHHRPAQGRAAAAQRPGSTRAPRSRRRTSSTRTTCSSSGCRWRTRSARCCSPRQLALRLRHRGRRPGRQDRRQPRRRASRRSWAPPRASSRRRTAGSSPCRPPRAA